jgi:hypothetical protein
MRAQGGANRIQITAIIRTEGNPFIHSRARMYASLEEAQPWLDELRADLGEDQTLEIKTIK